MCGIVGFSGAPDKNRLEAMSNCIQHRGPDDDAGLQSPNFSLGMRRLAIIDLTDNIYPVKNETEEIFCVFNGEIYNYKPLRAELKAKGHTFITDSDSEVLVHGYEEWGTEMLQHLRGMFAFAIYDHYKEELFIARDRMGIKPLYYTEVDGRLVFGSEIKSLITGWDIDRSAHDQTVYRFLLTRIHDDSKHTFFDKVKRLPPAHFMTVEKNGNYRIDRYWEPEVNTKFGSKKSDADYAQELHEKFVESMELHLITDVPLGVNLSGGLDSSGVTAAAAALLRNGTNLHTSGQLLTFSAIHPGETIDESEYIDEVVQATGARSIRIEPKVNKFWGEIKKWMYYQEEPTISTAPYAYFTVMREAKKYVKVLLSGQGGDELFAGYVPYFMSYIHTARQANAFMSIMREVIDGFDIYKPYIKQKLKSKFKGGNLLNVRDLITIDKSMSEEDVKETLFHDHSKNLNERLRYDLMYGSVPNLLRYEDKNSMANSIESRVPFLDHEFVEHALQLPASQKIKFGWNRYVYRNAMAGLMPEKNRLRRSKVGFVNNEWEWMKEKADIIVEIFKSDSFRSRKYWDAEKVLTEFLAATNNERWGDWLMFWRILSVEIWLRWFVDDYIYSDKDYDEQMKRLQYGDRLEEIRNPEISTEGLFV